MKGDTFFKAYDRNLRPNLRNIVKLLRVTYVQQVTLGWPDNTFHKCSRTNLNLLTVSWIYAGIHRMDASSQKRYVMKCF